MSQMLGWHVFQCFGGQGEIQEGEKAELGLDQSQRTSGNFRGYINTKKNDTLYTLIC